MLREEVKQCEEIAKWEARQATKPILDEIQGISAAIKSLSERISKIEKQLLAGKKLKE